MDEYLGSLLEDPGTEDQSIQEGSESEKTITAILSTNSEIMNDPPTPLVAPIQKALISSHCLLPLSILELDYASYQRKYPFDFM